MQRIKTWVDRFGFSRESVEYKIRTDEMFAATFSVDPRKQGIDERVALEWLKKQALITDIRKLPTSGNGALYVSADGDIRCGKNIGRQPKPSKALDFRWKTGDTTFYAMHKRTTHKPGGGSRDHSLREMEGLLRKVPFVCDEGHRVDDYCGRAVLDG